MKLLAALLVLATTLVPAGRALADTPPSAWDIAKDPAARERWDLHLAVRELLVAEAQTELHSLAGASLLRARQKLEEVGAASSPDVRLRFDLGEVYEMLDDHPRAIAVLRSALEMAPDAEGCTQAYVLLAYAYAKLDKPVEERKAYEAYLARETDERFRATAVLNLAEVQMRLGHLDDAVAGYREALGLAAAVAPPYGMKDAILAIWGLAVALDRNGDPASSEEEGRRAARMDPDEQIVGRDPNVFFVPAYERLWYLALGRAEEAKQAPNAHVAARRWAEVERYWRQYVTAADAHDRWLPLARAHLDRARLERIAADKRAARERLTPRDDEELIIEP
jgi:tetratricopeptide (TPR) repeat protein